MKREKEFCTCKNVLSVLVDDDEWGTWDVCAMCGKMVEGTYKEYNHYDGEDLCEEGDD